MMEEAADFFEVIDETGDDLEMEDEFNWVNMGRTGKDYIDYLWKHSRIQGGDNFLTYGIDFEGRWIITDLKKLLTRPLEFKLTHEPSADPMWASYDPSFTPGSDFGLMNHLSLYTKEGLYHNGNDEKTETLETPELQSFLVDSINQMKEQPQIVELPTIYDADNVHEHYNLMRYSNTTRSVLQDSVELPIIIENKWVQYQILMLIEFEPVRPIDPTVYDAETEALGGVYVISKIRRFYENNRAAIEVTISRDGVPGQEGDALLNIGASEWSTFLDVF